VAPQPIAPVPVAPAPLAPAPFTPAAARPQAAAKAAALMPVVEVRVEFTRPEPARLTTLPPLGDDVVREMSTLRVHLEAALTERVPRAVMLVSAQGGEGTTTVAAQFAATLARDASIRVLLVDANGRRPALSMRIDSAPAAGAKTPDAAPDRLSVLPLPKELRGPAGIAPQTLRQLLEPLEQAYDWIVVDGPPVLGSPESAALGGVADGVVVVVQAGRTKRPVLARSIELLRKAGGRVLGTVLNRRRLEIPGFIYRRI
jgi:Mrp family chromosome partitioning ATPase